MKNLIYLLFGAFVFFGINSCKKTPDHPPLTDHHIKAYSVPELKAIATCTNSCKKRFSENVYFVGVVIADEVSGNFYKEVYLRDRYNTGAIHIDLLASTCNYFIGDSIRINLNGLDVGINSKTGLLEIDSVDCEKHSTKFATGANPQPIPVTIGAGYTNYLCDLVSISSVGFIPADTSQIWADPISQLSINRTLQDCQGGQLIVRTSNYASFALQKTPKGNGTIIGIATAYGTTNQLAIRAPNELNMNGAGCVLYHKKDFEDNSITSGGWSQQIVGDPGVNWYTSTFSGATFAKVSGFYSSANHAAETWLISPALSLAGSSNPVLSFETMANYTGNPLEVWVSTDYVSGLPSTGTWNQLTGFTLSPTGWVLTPSGLVSLVNFKTNNTRIAFKYTSTTTASTTYEVDNIIIREN